MSQSQVLLFPQRASAALTGSNGIRQQVEEVFEYWKLQCDHPRALLDSAREKAILRQFKSGRTIADLKLAIEGAAIDPFSQGKNDRHRRYDDITLILRDAPHVEKFMEIALAVSSAEKQTEYKRPQQPLSESLERRELSDSEYEAIFHRKRPRS